MAFGIVTKILGLESLQPADQVKKIVEISAQELSTKLAGVPFPLAAVVDGDIVKASPSVSNFLFCSRSPCSNIGLCSGTSGRTSVTDFQQY